MLAHYYERTFGRHQPLHTIKGVLQHRAPADDRGKLLQTTTAAELFKKTANSRAFTAG
jgi:hypothetical protein